MRLNLDRLFNSQTLSNSSAKTQAKGANKMEKKQILTKQQSLMWARSIVRDAPWLTDAWPSREKVEAWNKTPEGQAAAARREAYKKKMGYT